MTKTPRDLDSSSTLPETSDSLAFQKRRQLGAFFRAHRLEARLSEADVARALDLETDETVMAYESGRLSMPVEDVYALTNLLNLAPEDVMDLIHGLYHVGTD